MLSYMRVCLSTPSSKSHFIKRNVPRPHHTRSSYRVTAWTGTSGFQNINLKILIWGFFFFYCFINAAMVVFLILTRAQFCDVITGKVTSQSVRHTLIPTIGCSLQSFSSRLIMKTDQPWRCDFFPTQLQAPLRFMLMIYCKPNASECVFFTS